MRSGRSGSERNHRPWRQKTIERKVEHIIPGASRASSTASILLTHGPRASRLPESLRQPKAKAAGVSRVAFELLYAR
jgi:hypothetical protein